MKRITVLLFLMLPLFAAAQIAVADFSINLRDQDGNNEATKVIDDNGEVCALIKIETTQKGFSFDGGTIGVAKVDDSQVGEIWVWVPAGLRRLTIKHQQLGVLRDYYFPMQLQKGRTYIMKLVTGSVETVVQQKSSTQWLVLNFEPKDAMVEVDGDIVDCSNGIYKKMLPIGEHNVRVSARNYHTDAAKVMLTESETGKLTISLKPAFGWIEITGPSGATVFIDNGKIGEAPVKSRPLPSGKHDVRVTKENWLPYREQVLVNDNTVTTVSPQLTANFVTVTLKTGNNGEIWVNGEKRGEGSVSIDLSPGEYSFESRKASHKSQSIARTITMSHSGTIEIPAPVAIVGNLSVDAEPVGAKIYIDGTYAGESPLLRNGILVGRHTIKASYDDFRDEVKDVDIEEGKTSDVMMTLNKQKMPYKVSANGTLISMPKDFEGDLIIGNDVTSIGEEAFKGCWNLTSVTIPNSVTSIGYQAFKGCTSLTNVTIPNSVTSIKSKAFEDCTSLLEPIYNDNMFIYLPESYKGTYTIPPGIQTIASGAFYECRDLTGVTIPNSVTSIGEAAFESCWNLTSVTIPNSVTSIGEWAFRGCTSLTSMAIPNSVTSIGAFAFFDCTGLTSVTIPNSVTNIGRQAFEGCKSLLKPVYNDKIFAYLPESFKGTYTIPSGIQTIASGAFEECKDLTSVTIPNSVTSIGSGAFKDCASLTSVNIPNSVTNVGGGIFDACKSLRKPIYTDKIFIKLPASHKGEYTIPSGIQTIASEAFYGCKDLTGIIIPKSVTSIRKRAFMDCAGLTSVTIPNSVKSIGEDAFAHCTGLTNVTIPKGVTSIGEYAFYGCTGLTNVTIPNSVTSIDSRVFEGCTGLTRVTIPKSVTSIEDCAFQGCKGLTSVTIPNSVTNIGGGVFNACEGLRKPVYTDKVFIKLPASHKGAYTIPSGIQTIAESAFWYSPDLTSVTIPNSVKSIGEDAFAHCTGLTSVTIPNSVTSIGRKAFSDCKSLTNVDIPNSVTNIGVFAFCDCTSLVSVTIPNSVTSIGENAFKGCDKLTIYVPKGTIERFKTMIPSNLWDKIVER